MWQTELRCASLFNDPYPRGGGIIMQNFCISVMHFMPCLCWNAHPNFFTADQNAKIKRTGDECKLQGWRNKYIKHINTIEAKATHYYYYYWHIQSPLEKNVTENLQITVRIILLCNETKSITAHENYHSKVFQTSTVIKTNTRFTADTNTDPTRSAPINCWRWQLQAVQISKQYQRHKSPQQGRWGQWLGCSSRESQVYIGKPGILTHFYLCQWGNGLTVIGNNTKSWDNKFWWNILEHQDMWLAITE